MQCWKHSGCSVYGQDANPEVLAFFDTNWVYDPRQKGVVRELAGGWGKWGSGISHKLPFPHRHRHPQQ